MLYETPETNLRAAIISNCSHCRGAVVSASLDRGTNTTKTVRKHPVISAALASFLILACGEALPEPATQDLSGNWRYAATLSANELLACQILDATLVLAHQGDVVDGTISGARFTCSTLPDTLTFNAPVLDGRLWGDSLSFHFDTLGFEWRHQGRIIADSIGGVVTAHPTFICDPGPCLALSGMWGGRRVY